MTEPGPNARSEPSPAPPVSPGPLGIVLGGGGARAAYQVGALRFIARRFPHLRIPVVTGVSAGAINTALLASHHGTLPQAVRELDGLWSKLTVDDVFRTDTRSLAANMVRWGIQLVSGGVKHTPRIRSLVDTRPLREYLSEVLHAVEGRLTGIEYNIRQGRLRAVGISTSCYTTGQSITWIEGSDEVDEWERPQRLARRARLTVDHVMASCALPLFFPAIELDGMWYGDGGIRLSAPLSPALHLGAKRILAVSTRYDRSLEEARRPSVHGYPPPAQVMSQLVNSVFLDLLDQDAWRLDLINRLVGKLPPEEREGLEVVDVLTLRPSRDLGRLAAGYEPQLPGLFRWLTRGLGTRETESPDALSIVLFEPDYLKRLMDLGEADAEERAGEIEAFLERSGGDGEGGGRQGAADVRQPEDTPLGVPDVESRTRNPDREGG